MIIFFCLQLSYRESVNHSTDLIVYTDRFYGGIVEKSRSAEFPFWSLFSYPIAIPSTHLYTHTLLGFTLSHCICSSYGHNAPTPSYKRWVSEFRGKDIFFIPPPYTILSHRPHNNTTFSQNLHTLEGNFDFSYIKYTWIMLLKYTRAHNL